MADEKPDVKVEEWHVTFVCAAHNSANICVISLDIG